MQCNLILNLANSIWFTKHKDIDVLSDIKWINENLNNSDNLLVSYPSSEFVATINVVRNIVISIFEGYLINDQIDFLNNCLKKATFYNQLSVMENKPKIQMISTSSMEDRIIAMIIIELTKSINNDLIPKIRKCGVEDCQFYFLDKSKNQNKKYCSIKCNNVAKVRRFREKNR
ncbi:CGNR zinc finger domain-containing protein [Fusibacter sp. JL216-2]|uniref:CGNR zinc finger domain-containing protein n=1 Tax=Fusibacter sp. JL216-2 TaxID=3071453 RepID=UPI003D32CFAD